MTAIDAQALGDMMDGEEGQLAGAILESDRRARQAEQELAEKQDRKSTRLNSSH